MAVESPSSPWTATILGAYVSRFNKIDSRIDLSNKANTISVPSIKGLDTRYDSYSR